MDERTFLENFTTIAEAPGGLVRLRQVVLELAFRGRLLSQDPFSVEAGAHPSGDAESGVGHSASQPHQIPPTWEWVCFGDVVDSRLGKMLDQAKNTGPFRPYLRNANVQWFRFDLDDVHSLRLEDKDLVAHTVRPGDLVICEGGEPGRVAICDESVAGMVVQKALHRSRPRSIVDSRYLAYLLRCLAGNGRLADYFTGATIRHLTGRSLARVPVPLAPKLEQQRIVAKVDELMTLCDELEDRQKSRRRATTRFRASALHALTEAETPDNFRHAWERVTANWPTLFHDLDSISSLREAVLRLAVAGRLTHQDTQEQPARDLLVDIADQQARLKAEGPLPGVRLPVDVRPLPAVHLPDGWAWTPVGAVLRHCRNGLATKPNTEGLGFPLLRISAGTSDPDGRVNLEDHKFAEVDDKSAAPYVVDPGDLLACRFNGNLRFVGRLARVPEHVGTYLHPDKLIRMKALSTDHRYLMIAMNSPTVRAQVEAVAATTAGNIGINGAQLQALRIPLPPLAEQVRIAQEVERLFDLCAHLAAAMPRAATATERLAAGLVDA